MSSCWFCDVLGWITFGFFLPSAAPNLCRESRVWSCWLTGLFTPCSWPFSTWLSPPPPHSHLHRSQHSLRLCIYFKPLCIMAGRFPRLAQCVWSTRRGWDWILNMARLASELTLHKKPSDLIPRFSRKLLILCLSVAPARKESYMACTSL